MNEALVKSLLHVSQSLFLIKTSLSPQQVLQQSFCSNTPQLTYPYCYQIVIVALYNSLLKSKPKTLHSTGDSL